MTVSECKIRREGDTLHVAVTIWEKHDHHHSDGAYVLNHFVPPSSRSAGIVDSARHSPVMLDVFTD